MGWKVSDVQEERFRLIEDYRQGGWSLAELCRHYGVSRPTGYKWIERYEEEGLAGLADRSRAPRQNPRALSEGTREMILAVKLKHPFWGARKIAAHLGATAPEQYWPAVSTIGEFLKQQGLTVKRRRRRRPVESQQPLAHADRPNRVWSVDFKGWFRTGNGRPCYPLTLTDNFSRFLLRCQALPAETTLQVKPVMEAAFREYGLPERIRSDNGTPFSANGESGLTGLSVWWIKLGIMPERIEPGCPQQNGRHERMHGTLQAETVAQPAASLRSQQERFDAFRKEYNTERPHEALGKKPPAEFYAPSAREYPARVAEVEYPSGWQVRRVSAGGKFRWGHNRMVFVSHALEGEPVGLEPIDDRYWRGWFGCYELGVFDRAEGKWYRPGEWQRLQGKQGKVVVPLRPSDCG